MTRQSHIVSFDDARRAQRGRASQPVRPSRRTLDSAAGGASSASSRRVGSPSSDRADFARDFARGTARSSRDVRMGAEGRARRSQSTDALTGFCRGASSSTRIDLASGSGARRRSAPAEPFGSSSRSETSRRNRSDRAVFDARGVDEIEDASFEDEPERGSSLGSKLLSKRDKAKRARAKEKADKRFNRQYGSPSGQGAEPAGPRAAVYKGEMGAQHKKAARMQDDPSSGGSRSSSAKTSPKRGRRLPRFAAAGLAVMACLVVGCVMLYGPAQQYYQEIRERDRLQAEYAAIEQRNSAIQNEVDSLSTSSGVEDRAREEFGWVKEGESMATVTGVDAAEDDSTFTANIVPGTIEAPETWYSEILDPIFGVK